MFKKIGAVALGATAVQLLNMPAAHADGQLNSVEIAYVNTYGQTICDWLDQYPNYDGVQSLGDVIMGEDGFAPDSAADIINASVLAFCPNHWGLLVAIGTAARQNQTGGRVA